MRHAGRVEYEYRSVQIPAYVDRDTARQMLSIHAEFGGWELSEHQIWSDGRRRVTVRRRLRSEPQPPLAT